MGRCSNYLTCAVAFGVAHLSAACVPGLTPDPDAQITCATAADCPASWRCSASHTCLSPTAPEPDVRPPEPATPERHAAVSSKLGIDVLLSWSEPLNATSYEVQVDDDPTFASPLFSAVGLKVPRVILPAGAFFVVETTLYWRVRSDTSGDTWGESSFEPFADTVHVYCPPGHDPVDPELPAAPRPPCGPPYVDIDPSTDRPALFDSESGNLTTPFRSIGRAIAFASLHGIVQVRVARREPRRDPDVTAAYVESIAMPEGIHLAGGYVADSDPTTADFVEADRDVSADNRATLRSAGTVVQIACTPRQLTQGGTQYTTIEGMWIETDPEAQLFGTALSLFRCGLSVDIRNNTLRGQAGDEAERPTGVSIVDAIDPGAVLVDNDIWASGSNAVGISVDGPGQFIGRNRIAVRAPAGVASYPFGIWVRDAADFYFHDLEIEVRGTGWPIGIHLEDTATATVRHCSIIAAGYDDTDYAIEAKGIDVEGTQRGLLLDGNSVYAGHAELAAALVAESQPWGEFTRRITAINNVLWAKAAVSLANGVARAAFLRDSSGLTLTHNTLVVDVDPANDPGKSRALQLDNETAPIVRNNILAATGAGTGSVGVFILGEALPRSFQGNAFVDIATPYSRDAIVAADPNSYDDEAVCPSEFNVDLGEGLLCDGGTTFLHVQVNNNLELAGPLSTLISTPVGLAADLEATMAANDWSLTAAAEGAGLSDSAIDADVPNCGYAEFAEECACFGDGVYNTGCGEAGMAFDRDDAERTVPMSIGAYQRD